MILGYKSFSTAIVRKIKSVIETSNHRDLKHKLSGYVQLPHSAFITDPYTLDHLPGIYAALTEAYVAPSLWRLLKTILDTFKVANNETQQPNIGPLGVINNMNKIMHQWQQSDLWSYMTDDMFFTCMLLHNLRLTQGQSFVQPILKDIMSYVEQLEDESKGSKAGKAETKPIYHYVMKLIDTAHQAQKFTDPKQGQRIRYSHNNGQDNKYSSERGVETAAVAQQVINPAHLVPPEAAFMTKPDKDPHGRRYSYTATTEVCALCSKGVNPHTPKCYLSSKPCDTCHLYGHRNIQCESCNLSKKKKGGSNDFINVTGKSASRQATKVAALSAESSNVYRTLADDADEDGSVPPV